MPEARGSRGPAAHRPASRVPATPNGPRLAPRAARQGRRYKGPAAACPAGRLGGGVPICGSAFGTLGISRDLHRAGPPFRRFRTKSPSPRSRAGWARGGGRFAGMGCGRGQVPLVAALVVAGFRRFRTNPRPGSDGSEWMARAGILCIAAMRSGPRRCAPMRAGGRRKSWPALGSAKSGASLDEALSLSDKILSSHGGMGCEVVRGAKNI